MASTCTGCGGQVPKGYRWHKPCLTAYRQSVDYRAETLRRDGFWCASCPTWWNRLLVPDRMSGRLRWLGTRRPVDVDHIVRLVDGGAQTPSNWQVMCRGLPFDHHGRKTRGERRGRKWVGGRPPARLTSAVLRFTVLAAVLLVLGTARVDLGPDPLADPLGSLAAVTAVVLPRLALVFALLGGTVLGVRWRRRSTDRLRLALGALTGAAATDRRSLRVRRWGLVGAGWRRSLVPTDITLRYPTTFAAEDADEQSKVEARVRTRLGWSTAVAQWDLTRDRVRLRTPDPFVTTPPRRWQWAATGPQGTVWDPIPVGLDDRGKPVTLTLMERHLLIGGETGGGKSNALSMPLAVAGADADCSMYLLDGKRVELAHWKHVAARPPATTVKEAIGVLTEVVALMDLRYELLEMDGRRKVERGDGMGTIGVFIDELALFTHGATDQQGKKDQATVISLILDLIQRGRAAGVFVVMATQRPSADVVPTAIRDNTPMRWALRVQTRTTSRMILGGEWDMLGYSASKIDPQARGGGYLFADGGGAPRLCRADWVPDDDLARLTAFAGERRRLAQVSTAGDVPVPTNAADPAAGSDGGPAPRTRGEGSDQQAA